MTLKCSPVSATGGRCRPTSGGRGGEPTSPAATPPGKHSQWLNSTPVITLTLLLAFRFALLPFCDGTFLSKVDSVSMSLFFFHDWVPVYFWFWTSIFKSFVWPKTLRWSEIGASTISWFIHKSERWLTANCFDDWWIISDIFQANCQTFGSSSSFFKCEDLDWWSYKRSNL